MPTTLDSSRRQIADAVAMCRKYRHQPECRCFQHKAANGEYFCTSSEALWSRAVDLLIDRCLHG
jgi:hypothetical protein